MTEEQAAGSVGEQAAAGSRLALWRRILATTEGKILLAGVLMIVCWLGVILLSRAVGPLLPRKLLTMTTSHVLFGRAAGMAQGYTSRLPGWIVMLSSMYIETFFTFISFPLFVLSYRNLMVLRPLEVTLGRARRAAETHKATILKFGIPGLLFFVWFPLWMTGPVVGAVIGYLIGLRHRVNMLVVLSSTYLAILCWGLALDRIYRYLRAVGPFMPILFFVVVAAAAILMHLTAPSTPPAGPPVEGPKAE
jgi:uncharacterized membrane protein